MKSSFLRRFTRTESFSGVLVIAAALVAMLWENLGTGYHDWWATEISVGIGTHFATLQVEQIIGEIAMSAFFLLVGLEVRREMVSGHLRTASSRVAPLVAALAGTVLPAAIYLLVAAPADRRGWPIPTATDIALAVGVFALLARRLHPAARILLLSIAVLDDVIGIALLALLSSGAISLVPLAAALALTAGFAWYGRRRHMPLAMLVLLWVVLLVLLFAAGLHPTLSGVLVALAVAPHEPGQPELSGTDDTTGDWVEEEVGEHAPPVVRLELALHPWVSYLVLPIFVLSHAGVALSAGDRTSVAAALGLFVGKPVAVTASLLIAARFGLLTLTEGIRRKDVLVVGLLTGAGLTVSSLLASAALSSAGPAILGVLAGSTASVLAAVLVAHLPDRRTR